MENNIFVLSIIMNMVMTRYNHDKIARYWIKKLGLLRHPEGEFYKETDRSDITIDTHIELLKNNITDQK